MPSAADAVRSAIAEAGGALRFDRYLGEILYGPSGFYTNGGSAGRRGDFITSPEVGPLFGAVLARAIESWWNEAGRPDDFHLYELGAGPGTLARSLLATEPAWLGDPSRYVAVEISASQRARHPDGITSLATLPEGPLTGVVIANELLDNLPFRLLVFDSGWREAWVIDSGEPAEILRPIEDPLPIAPPPNASLGARVPWQEAAGALLADVRDRLAGRLVVIDYAVPTTAELARRPWRDWLRTYAEQRRGGHYLRHCGEQDVTNDVCVDQLVATNGEPDAARTQAQFLARWGIDELVDEGRRVWEAEAARPGLRAMRMRSRISEAEALLDPEGLGSFLVLEWRGRRDLA